MYYLRIMKKHQITAPDIVFGAVAIAMALFAVNGVAGTPATRGTVAHAVIVTADAEPAGIFPADTAQTDTASANQVYLFVDNLPQFPGGDEAMMTFIAQNIKYPKQAAKAKQQGISHVSFVVRADGNLTDIAVMKSSGCEWLDNEALRLVKAMPQWTSGMQDGKAVNVRMTLPVVFRLKKAGK